MKSIVIGAGPAGLTAAFQLSKYTSEVAIFEAADCVGGLARSLNLWGQTVDLGPHRFFSRDRRVNELWLEVVGHDYAMVNRQTRILHQNKLFQYPLATFDALTKLGPVEALTCLGSYFGEWLSPTKSDGSFENWVCQRFGRRLFEIFFKAYSEKLWGISCRELDADFAAQRIKSFSLGSAIKNALLPGKKIMPRTLVDQFAYPFKGSGVVYERMAEAVRRRGGQLHLKAPVRKVLTFQKKVVGVELFSGEKQSCDHVISSMPLTTMVMQLDDVPPAVSTACRQLQFRNTILVYLEVLNENPFTDNWVYVHSPELSFGRVTNFRNWVPSICGDSPHAILALEYWCNSDDEFWKRDDQKLIDQAKIEIVKSGLVGGPNKLGNSHLIRIPKSYPIYRNGYNEHVMLIRAYLDTIEGLQVIGRYGAFKYNNQDHSILMGRLAAENIVQQKGHDLWGVNTDYETYQESCTITESGLVSAS
jgi:protoporphyrinogen oxidase